MPSEWLVVLAAIVSLVGSVIVGLVAWGAKAEVRVLRAEMALGAEKIETLKAEIRASIAESVNSFYRQVAGGYTRKELFNALVDRINGLEVRISDAGE